MVKQLSLNIRHTKCAHWLLALFFSSAVAHVEARRRIFLSGFSQWVLSTFRKTIIFIHLYKAALYSQAVAQVTTEKKVKFICEKSEIQNECSLLHFKKKLQSQRSLT